MAYPNAKALCLACLLAASLAPALAVKADDAFVPEVATAKAAIDPGPNLYVNRQEWGGAGGGVLVYSTDGLGFKGSMSAGMQGNMVISKDGKTAYYTSGFYSRIMYGKGEHVLQIFDVATLTPIKEIELPVKVTQYTADAALLRLSADERFIYVQNATPATSVTVVDLEKGAVVQEVPSPGCYGIYPTLEGYGFSMICNDGSFTKFTLSADGTDYDSTKSPPLFDVDKDPIYLASDRAEGDLLFVSYHGNVYRLSDKGDVVTKVSVTAMTEGVEGGWGTSGYGTVSYNDANKVMFVPMHSGAHDGSHYHAAEEVWAYDLAHSKLLYRSPVDKLTSVYVTDDAKPKLFGLSIPDSLVVEYEVDPEAKFAAKKIAEHGGIGFATVMTVVQ